jgi:NAD(P)-dependent dehydrogenase (short-subunit alcohol dehydrogenase family)
MAHRVANRLRFDFAKGLPLLGKGGSIVVTSSINGIKPTAGVGVYSATKAAVRNLVRTWVPELNGRGIRVNAISPGYTRTPALDNLADGADLKTFYEHLTALVPMGRTAETPEIANVIAFFASDQASYINGADIQVDGGTAQV